MLGGRDVVGAADPSLLLVSAATHDTASLVASEATLDTIAGQDVTEALARSDTEMRHQLIRSIQRFGLTDQLGVGGHPGLMTLEPRCALPVPGDTVRLLLVQELLGRAIYCLGPIFPSRQHDGPVLAQVLPALDQIMGIVETAMREEDGIRQNSASRGARTHVAAAQIPRAIERLIPTM